MKRVLVTGGAGFIGTHLVKRLLQRPDYKVIIIDNMRKGHKPDPDTSKVSNKISYYSQDIRHKDKILNIINQERIDACIHLAAKASVPYSILYPHKTIDINVKGTLNVLDGCSKNDVENFVFASSASVYGEARKPYLSEDHILEPLSPYAASKVAGEALVSSYRNCGKIPNAVSLRLFNVYGKDQNPQYAGVIQKVAERLSRGLPPIIYGDGEQIRDFISVHDVVDALILASEAKVSGIFNIGTGKPTSINELVRQMVKMFGLRTEPTYLEPRRGDIKYGVADVGKSVRILKFKASEGLQIGLQKMLKSSRQCIME